MNVLVVVLVMVLVLGIGPSSARVSGVAAVPLLGRVAVGWVWGVVRGVVRAPVIYWC